MIMGSTSGWLMFAGITARPRATSSRTNSGVIFRGITAPKASPRWCPLSAASSTFDCSRMAMYSISGVISPRRA